VSTSTTSPVFHVAVRDFDGDGLADLVAPRPDGMAISILRAAPMLRYEVAATISVLGAPFFPAVGELTGDSRPDIAVTARDRRQVFVLRNTGAGFTASTQTVTSLPVGLAISELTGDGAQDIIVGSLDSPSTLLSGGGDGTFTQSVGMPYPSIGIVGIDPRVAVFGAMGGQRGIQVARGLVTAGREVTTYAIEGAALPFAIVADLDGRAPLDLLCTSTRGGAFVARARADGTFEAPTFLAPSIVGSAVGIAAQDLNGDSVLDVIVAGPGPRVAVFANEGNATFTDPPLLVTAPGTPSSLALGDVDRDGKPELIVPQGVNSSVLVFRNASPTPMR
jgi:hypothetical protein